MTLYLMPNLFLMKIWVLFSIVMSHFYQFYKAHIVLLYICRCYGKLSFLYGINWLIELEPILQYLGIYMVWHSKFTLKTDERGLTPSPSVFFVNLFFALFFLFWLWFTFAVTYDNDIGSVLHWWKLLQCLVMIIF